MQIDGCVVLVTGGGSGLGAATARALAAKGARVAILDFNESAARAVADDIGGIAVRTDVSDLAQVETAMDSVKASFGAAPRVAVNCAGIADAARIVGREGKLSADLFARVVRVNLIGSYNVMSVAAREMQALDALEDGERGLVVNTASAAWEDGQVGQAAYAASKGGIASMCLPAARELARSGIRVMTIAPGLFRTPMMEALPPETTDAITANIPFPARLGDPDEFGRLVVDIAANAYLNGTVIRLDAGVRLPPR